MIAIRSDVEGVRPWVPPVGPARASQAWLGRDAGLADAADRPTTESFDRWRRELDSLGGVARGDDLALLPASALLAVLAAVRADRSISAGC
jgi:hypothetical protein